MSQYYRLRLPPTSGPVLAWAALALLALAYPLAFGANMPWADEWEFVPVLTGHEPIGPWLWRQHNEHRLPLPRLVYYAAFRAVPDFRFGSVLQVALLAAVALGLMRRAARERGTPAWADVFFPLVLLHGGHSENWLMGYQLCFALAAGGIGMLLIAPSRPAILAGVALALAACGAFGLIYAATAAVWLTAYAVRQRRWGWLAVPLVLAMYGGFYRVGYYRPPAHPVPTDPVAVGLVAAEILGVGLGIGVGWFWPAVATVALLALRPGPGRWVALGGFALALAVGVGRAGLGDAMGLWPRYSVLAWGPLAVVFLESVRRGERTLPRLLAAAALVAFGFNAEAGLRAGAEFARPMRAFAEALRAGESESELLQKYAHHDDYRFHARGAIANLRDAEVGPFAKSPVRLVLGTCAVVAAMALAFVPRRRPALPPDLAPWLAEFREAAVKTGLPRGLVWVRVDANGPARLCGRFALVPVTIQFAPVAGSDMEDNPNASVPRPAVAIFTFGNGRWHTDGRAVFNLPLDEVAKRFA